MNTRQRETSISWIGRIPEHWGLCKLGTSFYMKGRIGWQGLNSNDFIDDGPYLVTGTDFRSGGVDWNLCYHISESRYCEDSSIHVRNGDVLFTKDGTVGKVAYISDAPDKVSLNSHLLLIRPTKEGISNRYLFWVLQSDVFDQYKVHVQHGTVMDSVSQSNMERFVMMLPPYDEQQLIADCLDENISTIDTATDVIYKQLEILGGFRKSLIQEAATKGLDSDAKLKSSGVDWIGDIPAGWKTTKLKGLVRHFESGTSVRAAQYPAIDGEPGVLSLSAVFQGRFNADANKAVGDDEAPRLSCPVRYGTLLVSRCNTSEWVGTAALVDKECDNLYLPDKIWQIDCETPLHNRYVRYALSSPYARAYCWMMSVGASESMQNIASFDLLNMPFAIPESIEEMQAVVEHLDDKISKVDALIAGKRKQLETLRAQRQSLIYEYVTGKRRVV